MKRPYLNYNQRILFNSDTLQGDLLRFNLAYKILRRDVLKKYGYFAMKRMEREIVRMCNIRIFGKY